MKKERNKKKWWIKRQCTLILLTKMGYICFMKINQIGSHKHSKGPTKAGWLVWLCKIKWGPSPYNFGFLSPKQSLWILEPSSSSFSLSLSHFSFSSFQALFPLHRDFTHFFTHQKSYQINKVGFQGDHVPIIVIL